MELTLPTKIAWRRYITEGDFFASPKKQKELANFLTKINAHHITYEYIEPDDEFYSWFHDAYREMLSNKGNPLEFDVAAYELTDKGVPAPKRALVLYEGATRVGATIFFNFEKSLNIAFKTYVGRWPEQRSLRISPSLYSEYLLRERAQQEHREFVSLGIDRNPYGPNADIGLATFKFSAGYRPRATKKSELTTLDPTTITSDTLVFHTDTDEHQFLTKATLFAHEPDRYEMLIKQSRDVTIDTITL